MGDSKKNLTIFAVFVVIGCISAGLQCYIHVVFIRDALSLGWGGLVSPWVTAIEGFVYMLLFLCVVSYFNRGVDFDTLRNWKFWLLKFLPFSIALCMGIAVTLNLDGGGTLLTKVMAG